MAISYSGGERPRYAALRRGIDSYYDALQPPLERLRAAVYRALTVPDPRKRPDDQFQYLQVTRETVDQAVEIFLTEMAGPDRTRQGFSEDRFGQEDGVLQKQDLALYRIGADRGADLMSATAPPEPERRSPDVTKMLDNAFDRLSKNGQMRLESVKDDIHSLLVTAQDAGLSPMDTARQLSGLFDDYSGYEFERLARTEAAFASEAGVRDQLQQMGVEQLEWLTADGACPICEDLADGGPYEITDDDNLPPAHPNCMCSTSPVTDEVQGEQ